MISFEEAQGFSTRAPFLENLLEAVSCLISYVSAKGRDSIEFALDTTPEEAVILVKKYKEAGFRAEYWQVPSDHKYDFYIGWEAKE